MKEKKKYIGKEEALAKLQKYCVYQDRCHKEVRTKLIDMGVYGDTLENIIVELISDNFLNEERFACSYARGKFRIKRWGKIRITRELKFRRISPYCIKKAMKEIDEDDYYKTLCQIIAKKSGVVREKNSFKRNAKLAKYAIGRGFESFLAWEVVKSKAYEEYLID